MHPTLQRLPMLLCWLWLAVATIAQQRVPMAVAGLPEGAPLALTAHCDGRALEVVFELRAGWHVYARDVGGGQPVVVRVTDGAFEAASDLQTPPDHNGEVSGKAAFRLSLRRIAPGNALQAQVEFMVCDALECLPPMSVQLRAPDVDEAPTPLRLLLVAVDEEARTQRIATFLRERGCLVDVTTYATVSAEAMERCDVVLADSPTFRLVKGQTANARRVPDTSTPVVAVGFLGTELVEGHKVAMTSGYI